MSGGTQRFVCGMRRFDKHRMDSSCSTKENTAHASELQKRLRQREEQDRILFSPSPSPCAFSSCPPLLPHPLSLSSSTPIPSPYTPWKTPSALYSDHTLITKT